MSHHYLFAAFFFAAALFSSTTAVVQAATPLPFCPLENSLQAGFKNPNNDRESNNQFADEIVLINNSDYIVQGMQLVLVWYSVDAGQQYAVVLADDVALGAQEQTILTFSVDISAIPLGDYTVKPLLVAGDEIAVLGHIMNSRPTLTTPATAFTKRTIASDSLQVSTALSTTGVVTPGSALTITVTTKNLLPTPILDGKIAFAISQGPIPLGEAVKTSVVDSLKLFPGSSRNSTLTDPFLAAGSYTITALPLVPMVAQAIVYVPVIVGEPSEPYSFSYLAALGISELAKDGIAAVACIGETKASTQRSGEVLELTNADFSQTADGLPADAKAVSFLLPSLSSEAAVTLALLAPREAAIATNQAQAESLSKDGLVPVQTVSFMPECERFDICVTDLVATAESFVQEPTFIRSLWFYLGIMLAALLLQLIILRRLPVKYEKKVEMTKPKL